MNAVERIIRSHIHIARLALESAAELHDADRRHTTPCRDERVGLVAYLAHKLGLSASDDEAMDLFVIELANYEREHKQGVPGTEDAPRQRPVN